MLYAAAGMGAISKPQEPSSAIGALRRLSRGPGRGTPGPRLGALRCRPVIGLRLDEANLARIRLAR
jgi:hypothetical protein